MPPSCAVLGGFAIGARVALLWQHNGNTEPSGNPPGPPQACRTRTLRMPAKTPLTGDSMDAAASCAVPFRPYSVGVVTRTRNVSEYMPVLSLCLVCNSHQRRTGSLLQVDSATVESGNRYSVRLRNLPSCSAPTAHSSSTNVMM